MFKVLRPLKDAYITDRYVNGESQVRANVGDAGSLDLFKLYGLTSTTSGSTHLPNTELTRLLVKFDLGPLRSAVAAGLVDPSASSFSCRLHLHDVYGGQPTPDNFTVAVYPLSASFDEGLGKDVVFFSDSDACSWLTASLAGGPWSAPGCGKGGDDSAPCDYLTASALVGAGTSLKSSQLFVTGEEDLDIDVTTIVSATLAGLLPDVGLRISFDPSLEGDQHTYFVKRFASRTAFNEDLRPKLYVRYDDSVQDDTNNLYLDSPSYLFLYNYVRSAPANLLSGSTPVTGLNNLLLQLVTPVSGGTYSLYFTGSQHFSNHNPRVGIYSASVMIPSTDVVLQPQWQFSGSLIFTPVWKSLDGTVTYLTGDPITVYPPQRGSQALDPRRFEVTVLGVRDSMGVDEQTILRVNIFDHTHPYFTQAVKLPVESPGIVVRDVHYQVRDVVTGLIAVPFDLTTNSTRLSNDSAGMYFKLDASNLTRGHSYVIDVMIVTGNNQQLYKAASAAFRVGDTS